MRHVPSEIDFNARDQSFPYGVNFHVTKPLSIGKRRLIRHHDALAILDQIADIEALEVLAVGPADVEIRRTPERIVERAREGKCWRQQRFGCRSVFVDVGFQQGPD